MRKTCVNIDRCEYSFARAFGWWKLSLLSNICVTDQGKVIATFDQKVQRSGNYLTTSSNSMGRATLAFLVGSFPSTNGDDCFEWNECELQELIERYTALGLPVRDVDQMPEGVVHFCSHEFFRSPGGQWKAYLHTWERMLWESSRKRVHEQETDVNYMTELENHPDPAFVELVRYYLEERAQLLGATAGHDKEEERARSCSRPKTTTAARDEDAEEEEESEGHGGGGAGFREKHRQTPST